MEQTKARGTEITVPHLAESLVSATIGRWLKQPGDYVEQYDPICELITDKVTTEMPSPVGGTLTEILVEEGATAAVGAIICRIVEHDPEAAETAPHEAVPLAANAGADAANPGDDAANPGDMRHRYSPAVLRLAAEHRIDLSRLTGSGLGGRITRKDVERAIAARSAQPDAASREPAAAGFAASGPAAVPAAAASVSAANGSAPGGPAQASGNAARLAAVTPDNPGRSASASRQAVPPLAAAPLTADVTKVPVRSSGLTESLPQPKIEVEGREVPGRGEYFIDVTPMRHAIASRTRQSATEIPHAWTMIEADVTNLVLLRNKVKDEFMRREGINLTYLAFVLKAVVNAIKDYPIMNSVWAVDKIIVKRDINISLLVGTEDFVTAPVIKKADEKTIAGLAREIDDLTKRARAGKLTYNDLEGGTFTVNNTGAFGSILSYPIINYPQAAILTFESIVKKPVVIQDMIAVRSMVNLCLSLDHRILDGVICGRFLQRVKENLESYSPDTKLY
jgi:2-oxoisovalerate dehydrogenase E2 component (dihydrolipoyl transacylase)